MLLQAVNTILKAPIIWLFHVFLHELGGSYSLDVPTTTDGGSVGMSAGPTTSFQPSAASAPGSPPKQDAEASAAINFSSYQST